MKIITIWTRPHHTHSNTDEIITYYIIKWKWNYIFTTSRHIQYSYHGVNAFEALYTYYWICHYSQVSGSLISEDHDPSHWPMTPTDLIWKAPQVFPLGIVTCHQSTYSPAEVRFNFHQLRVQVVHYGSVWGQHVHCTVRCASQPAQREADRPKLAAPHAQVGGEMFT